MTIPDDVRTPTVESTALPAGPRVTRPELDREAPIRNWATLFGPTWAAPTENGGTRVGGAAAGSTSGVPGEFPSPTFPGQPFAGQPFAGQTLSDAVGQGYRVINDYIAQGQRYAEAMRFPDWASWMPGAAASGVGAASGPGVAPLGSTVFGSSASASAAAGPGFNAAFANPEMQQLFRRMMQYGWDFAGMWFEVWNRMGSPPPSAWAAPPGAAQPPWPSNPTSAGATVAAPESVRATSATDAGPSRVFISVSSERRTESTLELRRSSGGPLLAHALRPEGHDAPAISGVKVEVQEDGAVRVSVDVPASQPPGIYNGMIVDPATNLPCGTLAVRVIEPVGGRAA